ncbi:MAG: hypothetical protein ACRDNS_28130 [Trebonia sp.]
MGSNIVGTGSGNSALAGNRSGDVAGMFVSDGFVGVTKGYVSGSSLTSSATWDNQTFASLGVTPGSYVWTWGGPRDDSFTLDVAVPPPRLTALSGFFTLHGGFRDISSLARRHRGSRRESAQICTISLSV